MRIARAMTSAVLAVTVAVTVSVSASAAGYDEYESYFDSHSTDMPFTNSKWVPQGLTKRGEDQLVISYYDRFEDANSRIAIVNRATGARVKWLRLDTKGHVGGLAMTRDWLWVANGGYLYRYKRSQLGQDSGTTIHRSASINVKGKASYAYAEGETVWVGDFSSGDDYQWMYQYRVSGGSLSYAQDRRTPSKVQGVALTPTKIIWSQSYGRENDSKLIIWKRDRTYDRNWDYGNVVVAPPMSEGLVIANGRLFVAYESGSDKYDGTADGDRAKVVIRKLHHGTIPPWT